MLHTAQIESILDNFDIRLENFEIVNLEEKKGWSARFLYLIVEKNEQFILKGKSQDQLAGFLSDISISKYLTEKGFLMRLPVKTKMGDYHYVEDFVHWDLKSYVPGSVEEFSNYTLDTVKSFAEVNIKYIKASLNDPKLSKLNLEPKDFLDTQILENKIQQYATILHSVIGDEAILLLQWLNEVKPKIKQILSKNTDFSLIHNDLNNKNILLDLHSMQVMSFIDWDHGCISSPLKDIVEPANMFFDFVEQKYKEFREAYFNVVNSLYDIKITSKELNVLEVYFYALTKWKHIVFFTKLMDELGDSTGEYEEFENIVKFQHKKFIDLKNIYT